MISKKIHPNKKDITGNALIEGREYLVFDIDEKNGVNLELDRATIQIVDDEWCLDSDGDFDIETMVSSVVFIPVDLSNEN